MANRLGHSSLPLSLAAVAFAIGCSTESGTTAVGVVLPLTGDAAVYGKALQNGIELAKEQMGPSPFELTYEDDQGLAVQAVSAARRLIDVSKVPAILGGAMSSTAEAMLPTTNGSRVVLLSPTATKPSLTRAGSHFFRLWPSDDYDGAVMAKAAFDDLKVRRVSILYINLAYGVGIKDVFRREFEKRGGVILSEDGYAQGATDFRSALLRLKKLRPDSIYLPGYVAEISQILRQAREVKLDVRFLGVNSLYDPQLLKLAGPAAEGAVFTYPTFDASSTDPTVRGFVDSYRARYGADPDAFAAQGYDAYRVLVSAWRAVQGPVSGDSLRTALFGLGRVAGPSGQFSFDAKGDVEKPLRLLMVKDGKFAPYEPAGR